MSHMDARIAFVLYDRVYLEGQSPQPGLPDSMTGMRNAKYAAIRIDRVIDIDLSMRVKSEFSLPKT